jgi:hypothetical protein
MTEDRVDGVLLRTGAWCFRCLKNVPDELLAASMVADAQGRLICSDQTFLVLVHDLRNVCEKQDTICTREVLFVVHGPVVPPVLGQYTSLARTAAALIARYT